jgi:hypothetical protein
MELHYSGSAGGTLNHLKGKHRDPTRCWQQYNKGRSEKITLLITEMIAVDMQPSSMVEDVSFTALMVYLESDRLQEEIVQ